MIYAPELRQKARDAMKAYLPFALLVTLLASIPSLMLQMAASFSGNSIINAVLQYQYADFSVNVIRKIISAAAQNMSPAARTLSTASRRERRRRRRPRRTWRASRASCGSARGRR